MIGVWPSFLARAGRDTIIIISSDSKQKLFGKDMDKPYRADFCLSAEACKLEQNGLILHGSRAAFHENWQFGGSFFKNYLPKMMHWFFFKNCRLLEYAFVIR